MLEHIRNFIKPDFIIDTFFNKNYSVYIQFVVNVALIYRWESLSCNTISCRNLCLCKIYKKNFLKKNGV